MKQEISQKPLSEGHDATAAGLGALSKSDAHTDLLALRLDETVPQDARVMLLAVLKKRAAKIGRRIVPEKTAGEQLGVSRSEMKRLRKEWLTPDVDWFVDGKRIVVTEVALACLRFVLSGEATKPEKKETAAGGALECVVLRVPARNVKILEARAVEGTEVIRIRVHHNKNFLPGMKFKARPSGIYADVFILEGRCPRYRGRW